MRRRLKSHEDRQVRAASSATQEQLFSAARLAEACGPPSKKSSFSVGPKMRAKYRAEEEEIRASGDWAHAVPGHLVALYEVLHRVVYGIDPAELAESSKEWAMAARAAHVMVEREFGGSVAAAAEFFRWTWAREQGREKYRREHGKPSNRILWRWQFGGSILTDYRVAMLREKKP